MSFELDNILTDAILFYMENQGGDFVLDTYDVNVVKQEPDFNDDERFIALPEWGSHDGYRLMEKFSAKLKNPLVRQELSAALNRNKGVFRFFRDVLNQYPEIEKQWFRYKEQQMKNVVIAWYNALREEWGLEPVGTEPEDNLSLVLEDFIFREEGEHCLIAEASNKEPAGNISAVMNGGTLHITTLEVRPEYRGMGVAKTLLSKLLEKADEQNLEVSIDLPAETDFFSRSLFLENFKPDMQRFIRKKHS